MENNGLIMLIASCMQLWNQTSKIQLTTLPSSLAPASLGVIQCFAMPGREPELHGFARMVGGGVGIPGVPGVLSLHNLMCGKLCTYLEKLI